jgi:pimeloyl-ACP methyl ester carboxylesterase
LLDPYSYLEVRRAIEAELGARGIARLAVAGYSLGSYHAVALALARKVAVERLLLISSLAGLDEPVRKAFADYAAAVRAHGTAGMDTFFANFAHSDGFARAHPEVVERTRQDFAAVAPATLIAEFDEASRMEDLRPRLAEIRVPTLMRVGQEDRSTPPALSEAAAAAIPGSILEVVPGTGHHIFAEDAPGTIESAARFLDG